MGKCELVREGRGDRTCKREILSCMRSRRKGRKDVSRECIHMCEYKGICLIFVCWSCFMKWRYQLKEALPMQGQEHIPVLLHIKKVDMSTSANI